MTLILGGNIQAEPRTEWGKNANGRESLQTEDSKCKGPDGRTGAQWTRAQREREGVS